MVLNIFLETLSSLTRKVTCIVSHKLNESVVDRPDMFLERRVRTLMLRKTAVRLCLCVCVRVCVVRWRTEASSASTSIARVCCRNSANSWVTTRVSPSISNYPYNESTTTSYCSGWVLPISFYLLNILKCVCCWSFFSTF